MILFSPLLSVVENRNDFVVVFLAKLIDCKIEHTFTRHTNRERQREKGETYYPRENFLVFFHSASSMLSIPLRCEGTWYISRSNVNVFGNNAGTPISIPLIFSAFAATSSIFLFIHLNTKRERKKEWRK